MNKLPAANVVTRVPAILSNWILHIWFVSTQVAIDNQGGIELRLLDLYYASCSTRGEQPKQRYPESAKPWVLTNTLVQQRSEEADLRVSNIPQYLNSKCLVSGYLCVRYPGIRVCEILWSQYLSVWYWCTRQLVSGYPRDRYLYIWFSECPDGRYPVTQCLSGRYSGTR